METRFLESFIAVAHRGSLVGAAQQLNLTATAVAQRIRSLEEELGVALVERSGRTVRPTEAGHAILSRSEVFLMSLRDLRTAALGSAISGELRVGAIATALTGLFPGVLGELAQAHSGIELFLQPGTSSDLYDKVTRGALDVAAIVRPAFDLPKAADFRSWRRERLVLLVPGDEKRDDVAQILQSRPFIRYDRQQWGGRLAADFLTAAGIRPIERFELDALDAIAVMVDRGLGVSIIPDWSGPWPGGIAVRRVALPAPAPTREIGLMWLRNSPRGHLIRVLVDQALAPKPALNEGEDAPEYPS